MFRRKTSFKGFSEPHKRILREALSVYSDILYDKLTALEENPVFSDDAELQAKYDECMAQMRLADNLCTEVIKSLSL